MREGLLDLLIAVAASSGLSSFAVALLTRGNKKSEKKKLDVDSTQVAVEIWKSTAESLDAKLDKVYKEKGELRKERDDLHDEVVRLRRRYIEECEDS